MLAFTTLVKEDTINTKLSFSLLLPCRKRYVLLRNFTFPPTSGTLSHNNQQITGRLTHQFSYFKRHPNGLKVGVGVGKDGKCGVRLMDGQIPIQNTTYVYLIFNEESLNSIFIYYII